MANRFSRRGFLRKGTVASLGAAAGSFAFAGHTQASTRSDNARSDSASMIGFKPEPKELIKVGFVGIGHQGSGHVNNLLKIEGCQITAVCDVRPQRVKWAQDAVVKAGFPEPKGYTQGDLDFERMCAAEELDLVYNAAPWRWHTPISLAAMNHGKHAASEVNIALSVEDCWKLVETSEKTNKHCVMQENCCYNSTEMATLNMVQQGLFGEVMHAEGGYLHDLRALKVHSTYYQGMWRLKQSIQRDGNLYPTHGIGPIAWCLGIQRGDAFDYLVSMTTKSIGLNDFSEKKYAEAKTEEEKQLYGGLRNQKYALGDVNTTLIKTKLGKTIICQHDTNLPRPYSRGFLIQGSKGLVRMYPSGKIHIEGVSKGHGWEDFGSYQKKYEHPVWKAIKEKAQGAGHGGMDYIEDYRLVTALQRGITPDIDVYDSVAWSAIIPLSEQSIKNGSAPISFPDFTRGAWKKPRPLGVSEWFI